MAFDEKVNKSHSKLKKIYWFHTNLLSKRFKYKIGIIYSRPTM